MHQITWFLKDESATAQLGVAMYRILQPGLKIYLHGELGAGKTSLTREILRASGYSGRVKSPTYNLLETYEISISDHAVGLLHFDLYRMHQPEEFIEAGFLEYFNTDQICLVEWPEQADGLIPPPDIDIFLSAEGEGRTVEFKSNSDLGTACLENLSKSPNL
jgi:tRNA threonylcarbamoyladenosine biosynthesis protein TsaE